jgi:proteasome lid subunit RPN8/RPN11
MIDYMRSNSNPGRVLYLPANVHQHLLASCIGGLPDEACGLLAGHPGTGVVERCYPTRNVAESARVYTVDPRQHLEADRDAEAHGWEMIGVFHSHTHTAPYPSATDVAQAPDPSWHYVIVSLASPDPTLRSYLISDGEITEEPVAVHSG